MVSVPCFFKLSIVEVDMKRVSEFVQQRLYATENKEKEERDL
jgi:hypothetical protein